MKQQLCFLLSLGCAALLAGPQAQAQTLSEFKVDNATAINVYSAVSTPRQAKFTVKLTRSSSSADNYLPTIKLVGGSYPEQSARSVTITNQTSWTYGSSPTEMISIVTGSFYVDYFDVNNRIHTGIQAVSGNTFSTNRSGTVSITEVTPPDYGQKPPVTITNFKVNGVTTPVEVSATNKAVTYSMSLTKDPGYTDEFTVYIKGVPTNSVPASTQTQGSNGWTITGTQRAYALSFGATLSTSNVNANDTQLGVEAGSSQNFLLGASSTRIGLNRVNTVPCVSNVYLQNTSTLTGTITSGQNLYAGRAVTNTTQGDVIIASGNTAAFAARGEIVLAEGFSVEPNATFSAYPDGSACSVARGRLAAEPLAEEASKPAIVVLTLPPTADARRASAVATSAGLSQVSIYPNPAQQELVVVVPLAENTGSQAVIYSSTGTVVQRLTLPTSQSTIDVRTLPPGVYNLRITSSNQVVNSRFTIAR